MESRHTPVLLHEVLEWLAPKDGEVILDATLGAGGHARAILRHASVRYIGIDRDEKTLIETKKTLPVDSVTALSGNFRDTKELLSGIGVEAIDKALFDLGVSSMQLEDPTRGFSIQENGPLLMDMGGSAVSARDVVNEWSRETLQEILSGFSNERYAGRIARAIVAKRKEKPFETTNDLATLIQEVVPQGRERRRTHPATKTFQAIRMAVNEELPSLKEALSDVYELLREGGRMAVISFHSVEDRAVKNLFREFAKKRGGTICTKKPIIAGEEEVQENPRARSAKLRVIEK